MNFSNWFFLTASVLTIGILTFKMYYYTNLYNSQEEQNEILKSTTGEPAILIKKYQSDTKNYALLDCFTFNLFIVFTIEICG